MPSSSSPPPAEPSGPRVLVVDTASRTEAIALAQGDWAVALLGCRTRRGHSGILLPQIQQLLERQGWSTGDLDGFGVVVGPGSFTGVRVGIATVAGLARAAARPAFGYGSLHVRAMAVPGVEEVVVPVLDARRGEVYAAAYRGGAVVLPPRTAGPDDLAAVLGEMFPTGAVRAVGGGARLYADHFESVLGPRFALCPGRGDLPGVAEMAIDVARRIADGESPAEGELTPVYLRSSQAEQTRRPGA